MCVCDRSRTFAESVAPAECFQKLLFLVTGECNETECHFDRIAVWEALVVRVLKYLTNERLGVVVNGVLGRIVAVAWCPRPTTEEKPLSRFVHLNLFLIHVINWYVRTKLRLPS
ncbi:hypothetical protein SAMN04488066_11582 [Halorubrum aquaticum]|uniref:Uncharacterized protein n=1 Tax=Halorubrum aquaticum TaxID=387340 RepID=A0A1I3BUQ0_9EURY|nr:hypothetical protein SAMN04488066_11582 [Halorubrum aquaticum]